MADAVLEGKQGNQEAGDQLDSADSVVVAGDHVVDLIGVAVEMCIRERLQVLRLPFCLWKFKLLHHACNFRCEVVSTDVYKRQVL